MEKQISDRIGSTRLLIILVDFILLNVLFQVGVHVGWFSGATFNLYLFNSAYLLAVWIFKPIAQNRVVKSDQIVRRAFYTAMLMYAIYGGECLQEYVQHDFQVNYCHWWVIPIFFTGALVFSRICCRLVIKRSRKQGRWRRQAVFVGAGVNLEGVYERIGQDFTTGYHIHGYFEDHKSEHLGDRLPLLGGLTPEEITTYLDSHDVELLFCNLPLTQSKLIRILMDYCDNHLIRFYSVPNVRNFVHRAMTVEFVYDIPVLTLREEPLRNPINQFWKRVFDVIVSFLFLVLFFWWICLLVALISKLTMPGPVFFTQKRNGAYGKEFTCYKFRSMKVNKNADKVQATKGDKRVTKWGSFLRKSNIDELPQFINVFLGDMSVVGPRPHMVLHTEQYSAMIDKYMVRHFAKPGITGWAQVTGCRGETPELWMMEERIKRDIWYVENWTVMLDIKIIWLTVVNMLGREKGNAY